MGVLGGQPVRPDHLPAVQKAHARGFLMRSLEGSANEYIALAKKLGLTVETLIELRKLQVAEARLEHDRVGGDYHDEHLAGFAERIDRALHLVERFLDHIEQEG